MAQTNILLESGTNELEIVEFYIDEIAPDGERYRGYYGINVAKVLEIIRTPRVTELPNRASRCLLGTFNLRDKVIPLVDLSLALDKPANMDDQETKAVVTEFNGVVNAFKVSGVNRIHRLGWDSIDPPNRHMLEMSGESITGVVRMENRVIFILDMEKIVGELNPRYSLQTLDEGDVAAFDYKILVVDDSGTIRRMIDTSLTKMGFTVTTAINGREAWDWLQALRDESTQSGTPLSESLHAIVSDIEMPVMDGHSLTRFIKNDPVLQQVPVILFSSLITASLRHKGEAVGADEQISKPDMKHLGERVGALAQQALEKAAT